VNRAAGDTGEAAGLNPGALAAQHIGPEIHVTEG